MFRAHEENDRNLEDKPSNRFTAMKSVRGSSRQQVNIDVSRNASFEMPSYTSHTGRRSPSKAQPFKPQQTRSCLESGGTEANQNDQAYSESDQNLLAMLNSTVACLKEKNMDVEALGCLEQSLWLKRRMFGVESSAVQKALHEVVLSYNSIAMQYLALGQFDQCLNMLRKAEAITAPPGNFKNCQSLQILTFNNIGCCYRKLGKLKSALKYLKEAAQIGSGCTHVKNLSITHLNLCAIQSQLGHHDLALEHAQAAIFHTQEELVDLDNGERDHSQNDAAECIDVLDAKTREEKVVSLAVAYHNLAVELEFNGRGEASLQWYKKALQLVWKFRDTNQALCQSFEKIFLDARRKYEGGKAPHQAQNTSVNEPGASKRHGTVTRPKSAHHSSRATHSDSQRDISYSATVASQCYKPMKPSTAGLQYSKAPSPTGKRKQTPPPRPSSASTSRRRPLSASSSSTSRGSARNLQKNTDERFMSQEDAMADTIEKRWKQIETDLFGGREEALEHNINDARRQQPSMRSSRPQSARQSRVSTRASTNEPRSVLAQGPGHGQAEKRQMDHHDLADEDGLCGILQDDGDDDEIEAQFNHMSPAGRNHRTPKKQAESSVACMASRAHPAASARHRQALHESRSKNIEDEDELGGSSGYGGSSEDFACLSESSASSELPHQRVNHMEYLRKMKQLAEHIQDDLNGVKPRQDVPRRDSSSRKKQNCNSTSSQPSTSKTSKPDSAEQSEALPRSSSSSRLRERLEFVRRESIKSTSIDTNGDVSTEAASSITALPTTHCINVQEDRHVSCSEEDILQIETSLTRHAAARSIQQMIRGSSARYFVTCLRQRRLEDEAARIIQKCARQFLRDVHEREEEARRFAEEEETRRLAASLIQSVYRSKCLAIDHHIQEEGNQDTVDYLPISCLDRGEVQEVVDDGEYYTPAPSARSSVNGVSDAGNTELQAGSGDVHKVEEPQLSARDSLMSLPTTRSSAPPSISSSRSSTPRSSCSSSAMLMKADDDARDAAAVRIQSSFRRHRDSCFVAATRQARRMSRSYIERQHLNLVLAEVESKELAFLEELSAVKIQALVRGYQVRFLFEATRIGRQAAALKIQHSFRRHRSFTARSNTRGPESIAARCIQHMYRAYARRQAGKQQIKMYEEAVGVHHIAAQTIQRVWRTWCEDQNRKIEEWEAAACIQALGRGHLARKSCHSLKESGSKVSAFSIDGEVASRDPSHDHTVEDLDAYEDLFEDEGDVFSDENRSVSEGASGRAGNLSFLPVSIRELYMRFASTPPLLDAQRGAQAVIEDMLTMGFGLEELSQELESCSDAANACTLLDTMSTLVECHPEKFRTLPHLIKVARVLDARIHETGKWWTPDIEERAAGFVLLFRDLLAS